MYHFTENMSAVDFPDLTVSETSDHPFDALQHAAGAMLHKMWFTSTGRWEGSHSIDATELLREFSRWCALRVIDKWDAPTVVREYLETGDESLRKEAEVVAAEAAAAAEMQSAAAAAKRAAWLAASTMTAVRATRMAVAWAFEGLTEKVAPRVKFKEMVDKAFWD
jgi:hypothetical protein